MQKLINENHAFFKVVPILIAIENRFGFEIPDPKLEGEDWGKLTLGDLVRIGCDSNPSVSTSQMTDAVRTAVRSEFPRASEPLDFAVPILNTISSTHE